MSDLDVMPVMVGWATRRQVMARAAGVATGAAVAFSGIAMGRPAAWALADDAGIHPAEAIHQERSFKASPQRVYEALTDAKQFDKVMALSAAMTSGMVQSKKPAQIGAEAGGAFSLFGGYVSGRQIELVANERVVQAWRAGSWGPGIFSIARFGFTEQGGGTKLVFDHTGFPEGQAQHLAEGWKENYWEPLEKYLT